MKHCLVIITLFFSPIIVFSQGVTHTDMTGEADIPASFLRHYPSLKSGKLNVSELARVCDMSRTTVYKYVSLLEK